MNNFDLVSNKNATIFTTNKENALIPRQSNHTINEPKVKKLEQNRIQKPTEDKDSC